MKTPKLSVVENICTRTDATFQERLDAVRCAEKEMAECQKRAAAAEYRYRDLVASTFSDRSLLGILTEYLSFDGGRDELWGGNFLELIERAESIVEEYEGQENGINVVMSIHNGLPLEVRSASTFDSVQDLIDDLGYRQVQRQWNFPRSVLHARLALPYIRDGENPVDLLGDPELQAG